MSRQFYLDPLNPVVDIQKKKKYATFTVREIGGPAELAQWKLEQAAKEQTYLTKLKDREDRISEFARSMGGEVDSPTIRPELGSWMEKLAYAKERRENYMKPDPEDFIEHKPWEPTTDQPKGPFRRFVDWIKSFWSTANF